MSKYLVWRLTFHFSLMILSELYMSLVPQGIREFRTVLSHVKTRKPRKVFNDSKIDELDIISFSFVLFLWFHSAARIHNLTYAFVCLTVIHRAQLKAVRLQRIFYDSFWPPGHEFNERIDLFITPSGKRSRKCINAPDFVLYLSYFEQLKIWLLNEFWCN